MALIVNEQGKQTLDDPCKDANSETTEFDELASLGAFRSGWIDLQEYVAYGKLSQARVLKYICIGEDISDRV